MVHVAQSAHIWWITGQSRYNLAIMFDRLMDASDAWTLQLLTAPEVLAVNQNSSDNAQVYSTGGVVGWSATGGGGCALRPGCMCGWYVCAWFQSSA